MTNTNNTSQASVLKEIRNRNEKILLNLTAKFKKLNRVGDANYCQDVASGIFETPNNPREEIIIGGHDSPYLFCGYSDTQKDLLPIFEKILNQN